MVTIKNFEVRKNYDDGTTFVVLIIQGDLELVQSKDTGRFYATVRTTTIPSTFDEQTAALLVGREIPGTIIKESCDPYDVQIPETGEVITKTHRYVYVDELPTDTPQPIIPNYNPFGIKAYAQA
jgi:hypothetical protein